MGKFAISVAIACAAALAGGWLAGNASPPLNSVAERAIGKTSQPRLTAMVGSAPSTVPSSLWDSLDAATDPAYFPQLLAGLDAEALIAILKQEPRWTGERWSKLLEAASAELAKSDPERAIAVANSFDESKGGVVIRAVFGVLAKDLNDDELSAHLVVLGASQLRGSAAFGIADALGELDPQRGLTFAQNQPLQLRGLVLSAVYSSWAKKDLGAATAGALANADAKDRSRAIAAIAGSLVGSEAGSAINWAHELDDGRTRALAFATIFSNLAYKDPQLAAAELLKLEPADTWPPGNQTMSYGHALGNIFKSLGGDSASAESLDFFRALPNHLRDAFLTRLDANVFSADPQAALSLAENIPPFSHGYTNLMRIAISGIAVADPQCALELNQTLSPADRHRVMPQIIGGWLKNDADGAFDYLAKNPGALRDSSHGDYQMSFPQLAPLLGDLASTQQILAKIEALPEGVTIRKAMRREALAALFKHAPALAMEAAGSDSNQLPAFAARWAREDRAALDAWLESRGADERASVQAGLITSQTMSDPAAAAKQIAELSGLELNAEAAGQVAKAAGKVADSLAAESFDRATEWITTLGDNKAARSAATSAVIASWAAVDANAASEWIRKLPAGATRDAAAAALVEKIITSDPDSALEWAQSVPPETLNEDTVGRAVDELSTRDPVAAVEWLAFLPDEGETRIEYTYDLVEQWLGSDPAAAQKWIDSLPPGKQRDAATFPQIELEMQKGLGAAFQLADSLGNELFFEKFAGVIGGDDGAEVRRAIESLPAGPRREQMLEALEK